MKMRNLANSFSRISHYSLLASLIGLFALICSVPPAWPQQSLPDLIDRSLEDLMNIKVISVSKTEQTLSRTASAVFVITAEDIQRSGATNIPDVLRMVPGVDVAQINANTWAVSARGFNGRFSNELLVLVDGRTVYTPTFGGVLWDTLDLPLEDIQRIEVIRGPGGTIWGANAVNGVINIITQEARETRGGMVVAGGGNVDQGFGTAQYGSELGKRTNFRIFTKYFNQNHLPGLDGGDGADGWHLLRGGFRIDSGLSAKDTLMMQGDLYTGKEGIPTSFLPSVTSPGPQRTEIAGAMSGGFLQSVWNHILSTRSGTTLQISFDRYKRNDILSEVRNTMAIDFQHHFPWGTRQSIVWGGGYSHTDSDTSGNLTASLNSQDLNMQVFGGFFQDEVAVIPDKLYITAGTKLEHNRYTGLNWMPSIQASWTPSRRQMFWAAISQSVRTPGEVDTGIRANLAGFPGPSGSPVLVALIGNPHFRNETLTSWEMGYRTTIAKLFSIDLALYRHDYRDQQTTEPLPPFFETTPAPPHVVSPLTYGNLMHGETTGFEITANWKVVDRWTLSPGYAFEQIHMHLDPTSQDTGSVLNAEGSSPAHSASLRSHMDVFRRIGWDSSAYFVDRLASGGVPSYVRLDTGLVLSLTERLSMSLVGQNLLRDHHLEFIDDTGSVRSTLIKRGAYAKITWQFD